jgi:hypothetical protein
VEVRRGTRRRPTGGGGGKRKYGDHRAHADDIAARAEEVIGEQLARPAQFGIDPKLILVVELNRSVATDDWRDADLLELDASAFGAVVAFASDPQLGAFLERLAKHRASSPTAKGHLFAANLFDAIDGVRRFGPQDRRSKRLDSELAALSTDSEIRLDIELWHPGDDADLADAWRADVEEATKKVDGTVLDRHVSHGRGVVLLRVSVPAKAVEALAEIDEIASIDVVPQAPEVLTGALDLSADDLPSVDPPGEDAPLVALIDSGVVGGHPLIGPALDEARAAIPDLADGADHHGHGTAVAGLLLHGAAEDWLTTGVLTRPFARLLSLRVLDDQNRFPQRVLWENAVADAVRAAAAAGAQVINLSIGDPTSPLTRRRATPVAATLDGLARELGVVIVVPTGNVSPADFTSNDDTGANAFIANSLDKPEAGLIDPAPSALSLTVGGLGQGWAAPKVGDVILGRDGEPACISRRGPGIARGLKPELVAPSGTIAWSPSLGFVERHDALGRILCAHGPTELFRRDIGTSFAAPLVARIASAVAAENPEVSAPLTRALVLQSAQPSELDPQRLPRGKPAEVTRSGMHCVGHGEARLREAIGSSADRVVLVADGQLPVDTVVIYEVPLPKSFFASGGVRRLTLSVAFSPITRYKRLDYLGSRLYPYLFHGADPDSIAAALIEASEKDLGGSLGTLDKSKLDLKPSATAASDSANIVARWRRTTKMDEARGDVAYLAIRSARRWAPEDTQDPFGVALAIEHDKHDVDLHAELSARIRVPVEITLRG